MTFKILTIYRLFFITQNDTLFALTKDGRALQVTKTPYFSALSADKKILSGISFDGEYTHIFSQPFGFSDGPQTKVTSFFGYFYYPTFNANQKEVALLEADLLKPRPQGELCVYRKKIKKWYKQIALDAKIKPPVFLPDDSILFVNPESTLVMYRPDAPFVSIAQNVQVFNTSPDGKNVAVFNGEQIEIYDLTSFTQKASFPAVYVKALAFDGKKILYAVSYENRHAIYATDLNKSELLIQTQEPVILIDVNI